MNGTNAAAGADPTVFFLVVTYFDTNGKPLDGGAGCTGTLIAPSTILTAAHCVDPRMSALSGGPDASSVQIWAANGVDYSTLLSQDALTPVDLQRAGFVRSQSTAFDPNWNPSVLSGSSIDESQLMYDIGLVLLSQPQTAMTPVPFAGAEQTPQVQALTGQVVRILGYGINNVTDAQGDGTGDGVLREIDIPAGAVHPGVIDTGNGTQAICHGDSGGPTFFTFSDRVERLVGVHSYTETSAAGTCQYGADSRVDVYASFIAGWIAMNDPSGNGSFGGPGTCAAADGICDTGCTPVDPDCAAVGSVCQTDAQCDSRQCIQDPQHANTYCSAVCTQNADCPTAMNCGSGLCVFIQLPYVTQGQSCASDVAFCAPGYDCLIMSNGVDECNQRCTHDSDCEAGLTCSAVVDGQNYCATPVQTTSTPVTARPGTSSSGCHATGDASFWFLALAGAWVRFQRRRA